MKKIMSWLLMASIVVSMSTMKVMADVISNPEEGVLWLEDFNTLTIDPGGYNGWRLSKSGSFTSDGEKAKLVGNVNAIRYFSYDYETIKTPEEYPYLQVNITEISPNFVWKIQSANGLWSTVYVSGGKKGIFTFDFKTFMLLGHIPAWWKPEEKEKGIPAKGVDALGLQACSSEGFIEFDWLRMVSQPKDGLLLKLIDNESEIGSEINVVNLGDKIRIEVMLSAPAKEVIVSFDKLIGWNRIEPFSFDGEMSKKLYDDGTNGDLIQGDNVWVAEFPVTKMGENVKIGRGCILITGKITGGKIEKTSTVIPYPVNTVETIINL
ncbi:MAG: hypothetical protein ABIK26_05915 [Candidatus Omnitrophota bacterium]